MSKNTGESISKKLSSKFSQTPLDHAKQSAADGLKTAQIFFFEKSAEATGHLISIAITEKSTKDSKKIPKTFQK